MVTDSKSYKIKPLTYLEPDNVEEYFQTLAVHDLLKHRFCNIEDPQWLDVLRTLREYGLHKYGVLSDGKIVGEFALEVFTGRSALMHFSMHPDVPFPEKIKIGKFVLNFIFTKWINPKTEKPFLASVYGLTPHTNRGALILARKVGFKILGVLPCGIRSLGADIDAVISVASAG
jgi:hypothetical protein